MKNVITTLCIAVWIFAYQHDISYLGFAVGTPFATRLLYMVAHRSTLHLVTNLFAFNVLMNATQRQQLTYAPVVALGAALLATFGVEQIEPTVGLSGVCYALLGSIAAYHLREKRFVSTLAMIAIVNIVVAIWGNSNTALHALAFAYALILQIIIKKVQKWTKNKTASSKNR